MKTKSIVRIFFVLALTAALTGCKEDEAEIGEPFDKVEGLAATDWVMHEVFLVDEGNPSRPERNLSALVISEDEPLSLSFNTDGTFTSSTENNYFPLTGTWSFDDQYAPTEIILVAPDGTTTIAPLGSPTRINDAQLKINFTKQTCFDGSEEKAALGYRLVFNRKP